MIVADRFHIDFKKLPDEKRLTSVGSLLKSYQEEIDCLTRRAKYAEAAFLSVYRLFYEVPDPVPALVLAMVCFFFDHFRP